MLINKTKLDSLVRYSENKNVQSWTDIVYKLMEIDPEYTKYSYILDYYFYSYRVQTLKGKTVNIKQDIKKLLKSRNMEVLDLYRLYLKVQNWCTEIFNMRAFYLTPTQLSNEQVIQLYAVVNLVAFITYCIGVLGDVKVPVLCEHSIHKYNRNTKVFSYTQSKQFIDSHLKNCIRLSSLGGEECFKLNDELKALSGEALDKAISEIGSNLEVRDNEYFKDIIKKESELLESIKVHTVLGFELLEQLLPDIMPSYVDKVNLESLTLYTKYISAIGMDSVIRLDECLLESFKHRQFIVPYNGVKLIACDSAQQPTIARYYGIDAGLDIDIFEREWNDNYYIIALDLTKDMMFTIINLTTGEVINNNPDIYDILNRLVHMYGISDRLRVYPPTGEPILYAEMNTFEVDVRGVINVTKGTSELFKSYQIALPYYWKYRHSNDSRGGNNQPLTNNEDCVDTNSYAYKLRPISAFKKSLPKGSKASEQAKALAKAYFIHLDEGETFVSPFERKQRIKLSE